MDGDQIAAADHSLRASLSARDVRSRHGSAAALGVHRVSEVLPRARRAQRSPREGPNPRCLPHVDRQRLRDASFRHSSQPGQHGNARLLRRFRRQRSDDLPRMPSSLFLSPNRSKTPTRITNSPSTASSPTPPSAISSLATTGTSCRPTSNPKSPTTNAMATSACWSAPTSRRWLSIPT